MEKKGTQQVLGTGGDVQLRISIFGPSARFLSGITYYTMRLSNALSELAPIQTILFRHMLPKKLFPGWKRVGETLSTIRYRDEVEVYEILNWYDPFSWILAAKKASSRDIVIFEWWTSSVAHMYIALELLLHQKLPIIIEYHEVVDPLEQSIAPIRFYSQITGRIVRLLADHFVVHSCADKDLIQKMYHIQKEKITIIPHALYDHYPILEKPIARTSLGIEEENIILFFGLIRPYKGVYYLISAFNNLPERILQSTRLLIVGEAWEDQESITRANESPHREKITFINRYVSDREIPVFFSAADMVVLPYTRASQSGVAHIAMAYGLPIIATRVGGLEEGLKSYNGVFFIPPSSSEALQEQIMQCIDIKRTYPPPNNLSWKTIAQEWFSMCSSVLTGRK